MPLPTKLPGSTGNNQFQTKEVLSNRYTVERTLGSGNCGTALLVSDRRDKDENEKKKVVKKVFIGSLKPDETVDAAHEARLLKSLDHPNIVRFYDSFVENEFFCIVTEFCDGGDLDIRIEEYKKTGKTFPEELITEWIIELLMALQYMHSRQILHRDLKTKNIFLRSNRVKIGDFGISRILMGSSDMASTFVGTPFFMSPEVLKHEGYNSKSDIWSIGCILYELATLEHAFPATTLMGVMYKIVEEPAPRWPSKYSKDLGDLYRMLMEKNPEKRPSAGEALKSQFIVQKMQALRQTVADKYFAKNQREIVDGDREKIVHAVGRTDKLDELRKESDDKRYRNLPPRERLRRKRQEQADEEARRLASHFQLQQRDNIAEYNRIKQQNDPYSSTIAFGVDTSSLAADRHRKNNSMPLEPTSALRLASMPNNKVSSDNDTKVEEYENEVSSDNDTKDEEYDEPAWSRQSVPLNAWTHRLSADDRPITPMRNTMVYDEENSSLDFDDGIPGTVDLANTYYGQYDEFDSDNDDDESEMYSNLESCLSTQDTILQEHTLVVDDKITGAFGPGSKQTKINNLRTKLEAQLGQQTFAKAYNFLKKVRVEDRIPGTSVDEAEVYRHLHSIIGDRKIEFEMESLLFLLQESDLDL